MKQGPRTGNAGNMDKRQAFTAGKRERAPLASVITGAFEQRGRDRAVERKFTDSGISPNTQAKFKR